ncbi:MAG: PAS domain S-box protein [Candidatus Lokiarchaeota archaeon]|nr:PAS domain S-box protein [Candidatus Lokiarchaeota archaeon]
MARYNPEMKEEINRLIAENVNDIISILDKNLNLVYINDLQEDISGFSKSEIINRSPVEYLHPDDIKGALELLKITLKEGKAQGEFRIRKKDGSYIWVETNAKFLKSASEEYKYLLISRDITKRILARKKIKTSEQKYRHLFESASFSIILMNIDGLIIDANSAIEGLVGYKKEELIGKDFIKLPIIGPEFRSAIQRKYTALLNGNSLPLFEIQIRKKKGKLIWVSIDSSLIRLGNEKFIQTIARDVTKRKKAEKEILNSEKKLRRLFGAIPDIYFFVSEDTTILDYKGKKKDLYLLPADFLGRKLNKLLPEDLNIKVSNGIKRTLASRKPTLVEYSLPIGGEERYFEARILYFSKKRAAMFIREITQRKKAELLVSKEMKKLKQLDNVRKDLISRVSHELKTPIMSIRGAAELLLDFYSYKLDKESLELVEIMDKGGRRLEQLISNLLDISRIEFQKFELEKKKENLTEIVRSCSEEMIYFLKQRNLELKLNLVNMLDIDIDKLRIEQVITNLLSNAIKNTPPGGNINLTLKKTNNTSVLSISDTGVGLNKEEIDKLFTRFGKIERYETGLEFLDIQGSGLGLFISKEIVEMHEGTIEVKSEGRKKGSTFIVKLPI